MPQLPKIEKMILLVTGGLVLLFGFGVYSSLFYQAAPRIELSASRLPASDIQTEDTYQPERPALDGLSLNMSTLDVKCLDENKSWNIERAPKLMQIKGQLCGDGQLSKVEIINRSNGTRATIFQLKNEAFLSDYISMSEGTNHLILQAESSSGQRFVNNFNFENKSDRLTK